MSSTLAQETKISKSTTEIDPDFLADIADAAELILDIYGDNEDDRTTGIDNAFADSDVIKPKPEPKPEEDDAGDADDEEEGNDDAG